VTDISIVTDLQINYFGHKFINKMVIDNEHNGFSINILHLA